MPVPITKLSGLQTVELTLTKRGANNKRFAMTKGGLPMDPEVLTAIMSTPAEGEDAFLQTLKSQGVDDQESIDAAVASFRVQKGMKDLVDNDVMAEVTKAAGYVAKATDKDEGVEPFTPKKQPGADPEASDDSGNLPGKKKKKKMSKSLDLSGLDTEARGQVEAIFKSHEAQAEKTAKLEQTLKSMQDTQAEREYVAKAAAEYTHIPGSDEELGLMLKSAHDVSPEFAKGLEGLLGRMNEMVQKSSLLTTMGAVNKANSGGGLDKMQTLVKEIVQKSVASGNKMKKDDAMDLILKSANADELYREYLGDNPAQRGATY